MTRRIHVTLALHLIALWASCAVAVEEGSSASCKKIMYEGFDSRLTPELLGTFPIAADEIRGFELSATGPVIAYAHRLVTVKPAGLGEVPSPKEITDVAVNRRGLLYTQGGDTLQVLRPDGLRGIGTIGVEIRGTLLNSGNAIFLSAESVGPVVRFGAYPPGGRPATLFKASGPLRAASWNAVGLGAVLGDDLVIWPDGAKRITRLVTDSGLRNAKDVCLLSPTAAVVALPHVLMLVTENAESIVVATPARCRWKDGSLFVLDERFGSVWAVRGIEKLGNTEDDAAYASQLIQSWSTTTGEDDYRFREAVRLVGCKKVRELLQSRVQ